MICIVVSKCRLHKTVNLRFLHVWHVGCVFKSEDFFQESESIFWCGERLIAKSTAWVNCTHISFQNIVDLCIWIFWSVIYFFQSCVCLFWSFVCSEMQCSNRNGFHKPFLKMYKNAYCKLHKLWKTCKGSYRIFSEMYVCTTTVFFARSLSNLWQSCPTMDVQKDFTNNSIVLRYLL